MASLVDALDMQTRTWNGAPAVTLKGVAARSEGARGGALVAASAALVRPARHKSRHAPALSKRNVPLGMGVYVARPPHESLKAKVEELLRLAFDEVKDLPEDEQAAQLEDVCVLAMHLRDCRGGKGERALADEYLLALYGMGHRALVLALVGMLPTTFGSWKDVVELYSLSYPRDEGSRPSFALFRADLLAMLCARLEEDRRLLNLGGEHAAGVSLLGKWAPREKRAQDRESKVAGALAKRLFPGAAAKREYRKLVAALNRQLSTVEAQMSAKLWKDIDPSRVPSLAMNRYRLALLNRSKRGEERTADAERRDLAARTKGLAEATLAALKEPDADLSKAKTVKAKQLYPYEIVRHFLQRGGMADEEATLLEAQWAVKERELCDAVAEGKGFGAALCICDVSGSMSGVPMENCIALGLLLAARLPEPWKDRVLTFSEEPAWFHVDSSLPLRRRIASLSDAPWGGSTDFAKTLRLVLSTAQRHKLPADQMPAFLFCFTDMQFNAAAGLNRGYGGCQRSEPLASGAAGFQHTAEQVSEMYTAAGYEMPHMVFWNLNGGVAAYAASADTPHVSMLSGFSPELLKAFVGGPEDLAAFREATPYETLRRVIEDERYDIVRELVRDVQGAAGGGAAGGGEAGEGAAGEGEDAADDWEVVSS